jgi:hypothetical protein
VKPAQTMQASCSDVTATQGAYAHGMKTQVLPTVLAQRKALKGKARLQLLTCAPSLAHATGFPWVLLTVS